MQKLTSNTKNYIFSYIIITIPFFEFLNSNINNIDRNIINQLIAIYILVFITISLINYIFFKISKLNSHIYILSFSIFFWLLFRFKSIQNFFGGQDFSLSAEISLIIIIFLSSIIYFFLKNENLYKKYFFFLSLFFIFQNIFLITFISFSHFKLIEPEIFKNKDYKKFIEYNNKSKNFFSDDEIQIVKKNSNRNIYFFIFDGMTSLNMYQKYSLKSDGEIREIENSFKKNDYIYINNSYSSGDKTKTTLGSIIQLQSIFTENLSKNNQIYKDQLYPEILRKFNFENNRYPNLIHNLYKIDYKFIWLGGNIGCEIYNPDICINFAGSNKINFFYINKYILESFLFNTPITQIYNLIFVNFFKNRDSKSYSEIDFTSKFYNNFNFSKDHHKKNYFYFIHNLFPNLPHIFESNCEVKNDISKINTFSLKGYIKNYDCALKKIDEIINFLEEKDPNAIVIFQSDHGIDYDSNIKKKTIEDPNKSKIFNLIKVPNNCKNMLSNNIDSINSARLALSCATNTNQKLLER